MYHYTIMFGLTFFVPKEFLAVAFDSGSATTGPITVSTVVTTQDVVREFTRAIPDYAWEMIVTLVSIVLVFAVFQLLTHRFKRWQRIKVIVGFFVIPKEVI